MTPAAIALSCGVLFSPPAIWDTIPLPLGSLVVEMPHEETCHARPGEWHDYGCAFVEAKLAIVPAAKGWHGTEGCRLEARRHEEAHLKGWVHP